MPSLKRKMHFWNRLFTHVDALKLLKEANADANSSASPPLNREEVQPLRDLQPDSAHIGVTALQQDGLESHFGQDAAILCLDPVVCGWELPQFTQTPQTFFLSVLHGEPARRVGEELDHATQEEGRDDL